jgi:hypothetical protein
MRGVWQRQSRSKLEEGNKGIEEEGVKAKSGTAEEEQEAWI